MRKALSKQSEAEVKALTKLSQKTFACREDALKALATFNRKLKVCVLSGSSVKELPHYTKPGRPARDAVPSRVSYRIEGCLATPLACRDERLVRESCFILATNEFDEDALPDAEVLAGYQGQAFVERGSCALWVLDSSKTPCS